MTRRRGGDEEAAVQFRWGQLLTGIEGARAMLELARRHEVERK
jgi:hypothetical protein